jgi:hypothetical protein
MIDEYAVFDGMRIGRGNGRLRRKPAQYDLTWDETR